MGRTTAASAAEQPPASRLAADDWLCAALDLMVEEGIAGVKIQRLCDRLGVTKGSFYWHFRNLDGFLGELARRWGEDGAQLQDRVDASGDPAAGLQEAMRRFADHRNRNLTRAMRDWAQSDERARAAVRTADRALFAAVKSAILAMGFDDTEAEVRAKILYYAGVGFAHVGLIGSPSSGPEQLAATWDLITRR